MSIKDEIKNDQPTEDWKEFTLTEQEQGYLQFLNNAAQQSLTGFLNTVAVNRLGYSSEKAVVLEYNLNFGDPDRKIKIRPAAPELQPEP